MKRLTTLLAAAALAAGSALAAVPAAQASVTITQDSLINSPEVPYSRENVTPTLKVHSSACITVQALVVTARDSNGNNVGWGGDFNNPQICPSGYTLTPNAKSFTTGVYTEFGAYLLNNVWTNLPSQVLDVTATQIEPSWDPNGTHTITFDDEFNDTSIDTSKWHTDWWVGHPGDFMTACYDPNHVAEGFGYLALTLTKQNCTYGGKQYAYDGAILNSYQLFSQAGGEFEASVELPCNSAGQVYGWPAWWLDDPSFANELDNVEGGSLAAGYAGGTAAHVIWAGGNPGWSSPSPYCGWHTFGVQWDNSAQTATFYWDAKQVFTHSFPVGSGKPVYLIFDYQQFNGGIDPPARGAVMNVDWVRVWHN